MRHLIAAAALCALAGCTSAQVATGLAEGQLACATGPTVVAMSSAGGAKIMAQGATKATVDAVCKLVGGIAVSPPAAGVVPSVTVDLPASVTIPLKS